MGSTILFDKLLTIDDIIHILRYNVSSNTNNNGVNSLEELTRCMWKTLSPAQRLHVIDSLEMNSLIQQPPSPLNHGSYQGSCGGFGSEELEEWQRPSHD
jgi:hypothetical protein